MDGQFNGEKLREKVIREMRLEMAITAWRIGARQTEKIGAIGDPAVSIHNAIRHRD